ncbi:MAG: hypothetical protein P8P56_04470 [Yoonia sp.]|nr:hypothetical protein [Yoonia sp.]MDG1862753.1 hypothetical protein [Yoonia sp.]
MLKSLALPIIALTLLSACGGKPLTFPNMPIQATRAYADSFQDAPFDTGEISVISAEHGEMHTFTLRPCGDMLVCGADQGSVIKAPDYYVVTGAYAGRTFYISSGGDGWVKRAGVLYPMAWN